jgi:hypothetical protein
MHAAICQLVSSVEWTTLGEELLGRASEYYSIVQLSIGPESRTFGWSVVTVNCARDVGHIVGN